MAKISTAELNTRANDLQRGMPREAAAHIDRITKFAGVTEFDGTTLMSVCADFGEPAEVVCMMGKVRPLLEID